MSSSVRITPPYCFIFGLGLFDVISISCLMLRKKRCSRLEGYQHWMPTLPFFLHTGRGEIRKRLSRSRASCLLRAFNEFTRRRGRIRDCWRSENVREFYYSGRGKSSRGPSGGRQSPSRMVNVNKEEPATSFIFHRRNTLRYQSNRIKRERMKKRERRIFLAYTIRKSWIKE